MDISNFAQAEVAVLQLKDLLSKRKSAESGSLGVTICSQYQDDIFVNAVRPSVLEELDKRINETKSRLADLGVTFS